MLQRCSCYVYDWDSHSTYIDSAKRSSKAVVSSFRSEKPVPLIVPRASNYFFDKKLLCEGVSYCWAFGNAKQVPQYMHVCINVHIHFYVDICREWKHIGLCCCWGRSEYGRIIHTGSRFVLKVTGENKKLQ